MTSEHSCGYCDIGSYEGMIELVAPSWSSKKTICVDICIALEITSLWQAGIRTTGCCCGHGKALGYIGVWEEDIQRMIDIGYVVRPNETDSSRKDGFYPKTKLLLTSERATPSADTMAGLVRYEYERSSSTFVSQEAGERALDGEYVLHSQAAEIIAAKDKEIERLRSLNHYAALEAQAIKRAEAAEAKNIELEAAWLNAEGKVSDLEAKLAQYEALAEFEPANTEICLVCDGAGEIKLPDVDFYSPCPDCFKKD